MLRRRSVTSKMQQAYDILLFLPNSAVCGVPTKGVAVLNLTIPDHEDFFIKFTSKQKSTFVKAERINDTTISYYTPENFPPGDSTITIHHGMGQSLLCSYARPFCFQPKIERLAEILSTVTEPLSLIAAAYKLNENDRVAIDFKMSRIFQMNCPKDFHLLRENSMDPSCRIAGEISTLSNPTLLHFAARFNLVSLCVALLECPGSSLALNCLNNQAETPVQLAEKNGNDDLAQIMIDARNNNLQDGTTVEELYERMSSDIYHRYIEVKKSMEYEIENEEIYVSMESGNTAYDYSENARRGSNISKDRQSVYSSDSAISTMSSDSKGSSSSGVVTSPKPAPQLPPPDYKRKNRPAAPNPLIAELKKKTEFKRTVSIPEGSPIPSTPATPLPPLPKPPMPRRSCYEEVELQTEDFYDTPKNLEDNQELCDHPQQGNYGNSDISSTFSEDYAEDELYDTPNRGQEVYDVPPSNEASQEFNRTYSNGSDHEIFKSQSSSPFKSQLRNRGSQKSNENFPINDELYDSPTSSQVMRPLRQRNSQKSLNNVPISDEVYDVPPPSQPYMEETYDVPPANSPISDETYDIPTRTVDDSADGELYDSPSNLPCSSYNYTTQTSAPPVMSRRTRLGRSTENLTMSAYDESRDTVAPLSPVNSPLLPEFVRTKKRYSAPTLSMSNLEQQRLISVNSNRPPPLPPPVLPPRNAPNSSPPAGHSPNKVKPPSRPPRRTVTQ